MKTEPTSRECTFDGCDKPIHAHKLCAAHCQQLRRGRTLRPLYIHHKPDGCSFKGCVRPYSGRGYCEGHLQQERDGRPFAPLQQRQTQTGTCIDCDEPARTKGRCLKHYRLSRKPDSTPVRAESRVTSDKPRRNDKPKVAKPKVASDRNPNLPKGWESRREVKVRKQTSPADNLILDLGTLTPLAPWIPARMRVILDRRGALDLVDVLGLDEMADAS